MVDPAAIVSHDGRTEADALARVYDELRRLATRLMRKERADHTLTPTAVVHEAVLRLLGAVNLETSEREFLIARALRAMREVLIDHARRRGAVRRGGEWQRVALDDVVDYFADQNVDILAIHEALDRLAELSPRQSQAMTLRYFGGMTVPQVASALKVALVTVERDLRLGRAWLRGQLGGER
jgi:RNA polymerase sigma-70 factor, ECF subfamily